MGLNEKPMTYERIEKKKVMLILCNEDAGHKNRGGGSGTMQSFRSDIGACVDVIKSKTNMSTYGIELY